VLSKNPTIKIKQRRSDMGPVARVAANAALGLLFALAPELACAEISDDVVRIGVLTDLSGPYADLSGNGSLEAAKLAVEEFGRTVAGARIEVIAADHLNKPDVGAGIARRWYDNEQVDLIVDVPTSSVALAVQTIARERGKLVIFSTGASEALTNKECSPVGIAYTYDSYSLGKVLGSAVVKSGGDTWFFITADYAGGYGMEASVRAVVTAEGGKVLGGVKHPFNTSDFSSFILQAQASKAKIVALANAGTDTITAIRQSREFGMAKGDQQLVAVLLYLTDVKALGLEAAQKLLLSTSFYWDMNDKTRAWSNLFMKRTGRMPTDVQAGVGSAVGHYLHAIEALGSDDGQLVSKWMKENPVNDFFVTNGRIRADGRMMKDMYLAEVKTPAESKGDWDYLKIVRTVPADEAFRPASESECPLLKNR
jgi:branched-chain amino acid transport system substrate-binding protein